MRFVLVVLGLLSAGCDRHDHALVVRLLAQQPLTAEQLARSVGVLRARLDKLGVHDAAIERRGARQLVVRLPGFHDRSATRTLTRQGVLGIYDCGSCRRKREYLKRKPDLTGRDVNRSSVKADFDPATGEPVVYLQFTARGKRIFHALTRRLARRGSHEHLAVVVDRAVVASPYIDAARNPNGISAANGVQINLDSAAEARRLAIVLESGALPVRFVRVP